MWVYMQNNTAKTDTDAELSLLKAEENLIDLHDSNDDQFSFLRDIARDVQMIGLGEATHGNHEFHVVRARISQYLIERCGFSGILMEFPQSRSEKLQTYINTGVGNLDEILSHLGYWMYETQEIRAFMLWLRVFRTTHPDRAITISGIDIDLNDEARRSSASIRDKKIADIILRIIGKQKYVLWSHNLHISKTNTQEFVSMGHHLAQKIQYYALATLFYQGSYTAMGFDPKKKEWGDVAAFQLDPAEKGSLEEKLFTFNKESFFLNIKDSATDLKKYLTQSRVRFLGAGYVPGEKKLFKTMNISSMFDGLIFFTTVHPSMLLE